jgi:hypothetical protein
VYPETVFRGFLSLEAAILITCVLMHYLTLWSLI